MPVGENRGGARFRAPEARASRQLRFYDNGICQSEENQAETPLFVCFKFAYSNLGEIRVCLEDTFEFCASWIPRPCACERS